MKRKTDDMSSEEEVDRISSLPEDVLHTIFSSLNTKHAVQTCVLSKRWRYFWTSLPYLNFDFNSFPFSGSFDPTVKMRSFKQFVMRVLSFHRRPNIQKLNFSTPIFVEASLVKTMIRYAARRSVQELSIHARFNKCLEFARCLFSCKSLTALCLSGIFYENLDQVLGFPALKSFCLDCLLVRTVISAPSLINLTLLNVSKDLNISAPKLENLEIFSNPFTFGQDFKVVVSTPSLVSFKFDGFIPELGSTENLSCIEKVDIALLPEHDYRRLPDGIKQKIALNMITMLDVLRTAKSLTLSLIAIELLCMAPSLLEREPLIVCNLKYLELKSESKGTTRNMPTNVKAYLLKISPFVENLILDDGTP